ncbi:MAG: SRPBCC family protein [Cyclobacteriaceae bacterium]|nr:SRPBCC family protein [Cyclobacteriaceae bacterium]
MVDISTQIVIKCPVEKVATYAAGPENAPEWYVNIESVRMLGPRSLQKGSHMEFKAHFLGRTLVYIYEIIEFIKYEKLVMRTHEGPFPMETSYIWEKLDEKTTRMTLRNTGQPEGFSKWIAPLMGLMIRRANKKDLDRLRQIMEQSC